MKEKITELERGLEGRGYTYDQALGAIVFMLAGQRQKAEKILDFFKDKAKRKEGLYYTAYNSRNGDIAEGFNRVGSTAWVGISMAIYTQLYGDNRYLPTIKSVADAIIRLQKDNGGIKGGPFRVTPCTTHQANALYRTTSLSMKLQLLYNVLAIEELRCHW